MGCWLPALRDKIGLAIGKRPVGAAILAGAPDPLRDC
jgi:hypothetical protein